jgi:hypothetical protein
VPHGELPILADDSAELHVKVELQLSVPDEPGFDPYAEIRVLEGFAGALAGPANGVVVEGLPRHARTPQGEDGLPSAQKLARRRFFTAWALIGLFEPT